MNNFTTNHFLQLFNNIYSYAHTGQSININSLKFAPKTGYMVSIFNVGTFETIQETIPGKVIANVKSFHNGTNKNYLGVWTDKTTGKIYFDISIWCADLEHAVKIGKEHAQIAIYDLKNNCDINL